MQADCKVVLVCKVLRWYIKLNFLNFVIFILALSSIKRKSLNQIIHSYHYYYLDIIYYNPFRQVQYVSIPSWDHYQGQL
jgi:hypothetical protein